MIIKGIGDLPSSSSGTGTVELETDDPDLQAAFLCALKGPLHFRLERDYPIEGVRRRDRCWVGEVRFELY